MGHLQKPSDQRRSRRGRTEVVKALSLRDKHGRRLRQDLAPDARRPVHPGVRLQPSPRAGVGASGTARGGAGPVLISARTTVLGTSQGVTEKFEPHVQRRVRGGRQSARTRANVAFSPQGAAEHFPRLSRRESSCAACEERPAEALPVRRPPRLLSQIKESTTYPVDLETAEPRTHAGRF